MRIWRQLAIGFAVAAAILLGLLAYLGTASDNLSITAEVPDTVAVNEAFDVTVTIKNQTDSAQTIVSIGLSDSLQDQGLMIEDTVPDYRTVDQRSIWSEYTFSITRRPIIEAGDSVPLHITLVATRPGPIDGDLTLWLENQLQATYVDFQIEVTEE